MAFLYARVCKPPPPYEKIYSVYVQCMQTLPRLFPFSFSFITLSLLHFIATKIILKDGLDQLLFVDLAHGIAWYMIHHPEHLRNLVGHESPLESAPHIHSSPLLFWHILLVQNDDRTHFLAPFAGGHSQDCGFGHLGQREQFALHFERRDLFAAGFDYVGRFAAQDKVHVAAGPVLGLLRLGVLSGGGDQSAHGNVARLEPFPSAVWVVDEFLCGRFGVTPVGAKHGGTTQLDLACALAAGGRVDFLTGGNNLVGVGVDEAGLDGGQGPADGAVDAVGKGEAAGEGHADFGHAEAFEEDVAVGEVGPGAFDGGGEGGGAGDGEAEVLRGDGGAGGGLEVCGEGAVGGEEAGVDGGDDGEEGDFGGRVVMAAAAVGAVGGRVAVDSICSVGGGVAVNTIRSVRSSMAIDSICSVGGGAGGGVTIYAIGSIRCRTVRLDPIPICLDDSLIHERRRKPLPHGVCVEWVQKLHATASKQRRKNRIDRAVDVV